MQKKTIIISCIALFMLLICSQPSLLAQDQEYRDYTVERGDTLWDITKEALEDPFLWPKVWNANPDISNPDRIYPNQKIKIPLFLEQKEITPRAPERIVKPLERPMPEEEPIRIAKPAKKEYLVDKNLLILSGYIAESVHSEGEIYDKPGDMTNLSKGDLAYIKTSKPVKKGDKFYIIYPAEKVYHPVTGNYMGVRIAILGTAEVVDEQDPTVRIVSSFLEIPMGSLIDTYYDIQPPLAPDQPRKPAIKGYIVTALRNLHAHGNWDIVFIDKGEKDGLAAGDLLATTLQSQHTIHNGIIQIINTRPATSAAIIRKASKEVERGDPVTPVMQQ